MRWGTGNLGIWLFCTFSIKMHQKVLVTTGEWVEQTKSTWPSCGSSRVILLDISHFKLSVCRCNGPMKYGTELVTQVQSMWKKIDDNLHSMRLLLQQCNPAAAWLQCWRIHSNNSSVKRIQTLYRLPKICYKLIVLILVQNRKYKPHYPSTYWGTDRHGIHH